MMTRTKDVVQSVPVVVRHLVLAIVMVVAPTIVMASVVVIAGLIANLRPEVNCFGGCSIRCILQNHCFYWNQKALDNEKDNNIHRYKRLPISM
jgi:hypothetical protein